MSDELNLSPSMLADLAALSRGEAPPERVWYERPWKVGEPCWAMFVGSGDDVHIYPCRITKQQMWSDGAVAEGTYVQLDPAGDGSIMLFSPEEAHSFRLVKVVPRIVEGESW